MALLRLSFVGLVAVMLPYFSFKGVESAACASGVTHLAVSSVADAQALVAAMNCTGGGVFDVTWSGSANITESFQISSGSNVTITGSSGVAATLNNEPVALIDAGEHTRMFVVSNASLSLKNLVLQGGKTSEDGGAIRVDSASSLGSAVVNIFDCAFRHNTATQAGGAIYAENASVFIDGSTTFTDNNADLGRGGAIHATTSTVTITGSAAFKHNTAEDGGGLSAYNSTVAVFGEAVFESNAAGFGGAIHVWSDSTVTINDAVRFSSNSAFEGGAIQAILGSSVAVYGAVSFNNNVANDGGALYSDHGRLAVDGSVYFSGNKAIVHGGAVYISNPDELILKGSTFTSNVAEFGGAVAMGETGEKGAEVMDCVFEDNRATDGGALHFDSNQYVETITNSSFIGNYAEDSGGALYHTGQVEMVDTYFVANTAGKEGTAIFSIGSLEKLTGVVFIDNTLRCPSGEFANEYEVSSSLCRFDLTCARCSTGCDNIPEGVVVIIDDTIPVCDELMEGVRSSSNGTTIANLDLKEGYYRTSTSSTVIYECFVKEACVGGTIAENYCAEGYQGPYCAVCASGYSHRSGYNCQECSDASISSAAVVGATVLLALTLAVVPVLVDLIQVIDDGGAEASWKQRFSACHALVVKAIPLTATKTVVVVWQIIAQFGAVAGHVYPEEYQRFLSVLRIINLDVGFILSYSCLVTTNFYHRLLIATIWPAVGLAVLAVTFSMAMKRNVNSEEAIRAVKHKHLVAALFLVFFVYSSVSFTILQTFVCDTLNDGESYLRADYSLSCDTAEHSWFVAYASMMVCVYPIGIPFAFTWWLLQNRQDLQNSDRAEMTHLQPLRGLWAAYKPSRYYYEVVECGRRIMLTGIAEYARPNGAAHIAVVLLLTLVFLFISESLSPFDYWVDMGLYRWGNGVILASTYVALLLKFGVSEDDTSTSSAFAGVLIAANVFMAIALVVESCLRVKESSVTTRTVREVANPLFLRTSRSSRWLDDGQKEDKVESVGQLEGETLNSSSSGNLSMAGSAEHSNDRRARGSLETNF